MSEISCLLLNITKLKKQNVFVSSRNVCSTTLTMCCINDLLCMDTSVENLFFYFGA